MPALVAVVGGDSDGHPQDVQADPREDTARAVEGIDVVEGHEASPQVDETRQTEPDAQQGQRARVEGVGGHAWVAVCGEM